MNSNDLKKALIHTITAKLVPMIHGSPALGKSSIVHQIAKKFNLKLIDVRLSQCSPEDLLGLISFNENRTKASYVPLDFLPLEGASVPTGYSGYLLFLDEFNSASLSTQAAAFKLILDKKVGNTPLHKKVAIVCAGNKTTDKGITNRISTPMQSRLIHLNLDVDTPSWIDWAIKNNIDHRIVSFIRFRPDNLYKFDPNHNDHTFPSPRTYEFLSCLILKQAVTYELLPIIEGTIGKGMAREFIGYTDIYQTLPSIEDIINNTCNVPTEPSTLFAITGLISTHIHKDNADSLSKFIVKLPIEFQVITIKQALLKDISLMEVPSISTWVENNNSILD